jgi:hypothetical protein
MEASGRVDYELVQRPFVRAIAIPRSVLCPAPGAVISTHGVRLRLDTAETVAPERLECELTLGRKPVPPLAGGGAWRIPASARGQRGALRLLVVYGATEYRDSFAIQVQG